MEKNLKIKKKSIRNISDMKDILQEKSVRTKGSTEETRKKWKKN